MPFLLALQPLSDEFGGAIEDVTFGLDRSQSVVGLVVACVDVTQEVGEIKAGLGKPDCGTNGGEDGDWVHDEKKGERRRKQRWCVCMIRDGAGYRGEVETWVGRATRPSAGTRLRRCSACHTCSLIRGSYLRSDRKRGLKALKSRLNGVHTIISNCRNQL